MQQDEVFQEEDRKTTSPTSLEVCKNSPQRSIVWEKELPTELCSLRENIEMNPTDENVTLNNKAEAA